MKRPTRDYARLTQNYTELRRTTQNYIPSLAIVSIVLAAYEAFALLADKPTLTTLSTRKGWEIPVWGWLAWVAVHFWRERRSVSRTYQSKG